MSLSHPLPRIDEVVLLFLFGVILTLVAVVVGLWAWAISRLARGRPLLSSVPVLPLGPARWGGWSVAAVVLLYVGANLAVGIGYGALTGVRRRAQPTGVQAAAHESASAPAAAPATDRPRIPSYHLMLINALASLLVLAFLPVVLRRTAGVGVAELGVSWKSWPRQVVVGVGAALLTTPAVYAVQTLAARYWEVNDHDVQKMMAEDLSLDTALFAFFSTVFVAPVVEESLFRGVLLGWLTRLFSPAPPAAPPRSVVLADAIVAEAEPGTPSEPPSPAIAPESEPEVPAVEAVSDVAANGPNTVSLPAIIATSLLFAAMHASQWPAPLGIFFLSIVLGVVYQRTGSLSTAIVMHGVFNGCGTLLLVTSLLGKAVQDVNGGAAAVAPGSWSAIRAAVGWTSTFF